MSLMKGNSEAMAIVAARAVFPDPDGPIPVSKYAMPEPTMQQCADQRSAIGIPYLLDEQTSIFEYILLISTAYV